MDMGGHEHMQDSSLRMELNYAFARGFWYTIAGVIGALVAVRAINHLDHKQRCVKTSKSLTSFYPMLNNHLQLKSMS